MSEVVPNGETHTELVPPTFVEHLDVRRGELAKTQEVIKRAQQAQEAARTEYRNELLKLRGKTVIFTGYLHASERYLQDSIDMEYTSGQRVQDLEGVVTWTTVVDSLQSRGD